MLKNNGPADVDMQAAVADEVNRRMELAGEQLKQKYAAGLGGNDQSVTGPSGSAYKEAAADAKKSTTSKKKESEKRSELQELQKKESMVEKAIQDDEEFADPELERLRELRMRDLQNKQKERVENIGKGHGQYREIAQDDFLAEVTGSMRVLCHFYHKDFERCKIVDHHLAKLAPRHIECKFIKADAEKMPFFVEKLKIRTMPTIICFVDGVAVDKVIGFEGLADGLPEGKEDEWPTIRLASLLASKRMLDKENVVDEDAVANEQRKKMDSIRAQYMQATFEDDDFDLLDV
jgi:hypothetical protein